MSTRAAIIIAGLMLSISVLVGAFVVALDTDSPCPPWMDKRDSQVLVQDIADEDIEWLEDCGFRDMRP